MAKDYSEYRALTYFRQSVIARWLPGGNPVSPCIRCRVPDAKFVQIKMGKSRARYTGLQHCKRLWLCPICASHASNLKRKQLKTCIDNLAREGYSLAFITYTVRHKAEDNLERVAGLVGGAHRYMHAGRAWVATERAYGWFGSVKSVEVTLSVNGWHFHLHELAFVYEDCDRDALQDDLRSAWKSQVERLGGSIVEKRGLLVKEADRSVKDYVNKWGIVPELASGQDKSSRMDGVLPFQLPDIIMDRPQRELWAADAFSRYAIGVHGIKQFWASPSVRKFFKKDIAEDAPSDEAARALLPLSDDQWRAIKRQGLRPWALRAAEAGDLTDFLMSLKL